ncbi:MAG TPA: 4Fe-4S dicluster domain-containing protein [Acidimicrobiales bacterium]|nr:4Fe-4S dicluster domain-containing protein [Acidimicrobiales bacterium]
MTTDRREDAALIEPAAVAARVTLDVAGLDALLGAIRGAGYRLIGPTVRDRAVVLDEIESVAELPAGWGDEQEGGNYRLRRRDDGALFGWAVGAHSWKPYVFPPRVTLWSASRDAGGMRIEPGPDDAGAPLAFFGVRSCDLHAMAVQDRVFLGGDHPDPHYARRRQGLLVVAVNCSDPAATCFCPSMGTGPRAVGGYDLALTELLDAADHRFVVEAATERGVDLLAGLPTRPAPAADVEAAAEVTVRARERIVRTVETDGIRDLLAANLEHPRWDDVAERCLACTNCTLVCPTCFCSAVEDHSDLAGEHAERTRRWDSCFTLDHSYLHGGSVRPTHRDRYRQWLTHKLGTWIDQFGSSGCVGCGRCVTWCPVGIDLTEEVAAIRAEPGGAALPYPAPGSFR